MASCSALLSTTSLRVAKAGRLSTTARMVLAVAVSPSRGVKLKSFVPGSTAAVIR